MFSHWKYFHKCPQWRSELNKCGMPHRTQKKEQLDTILSEKNKSLYTHVHRRYCWGKTWKGIWLKVLETSQETKEEIKHGEGKLKPQACSPGSLWPTVKHMTHKCLATPAQGLVALKTAHHTLFFCSFWDKVLLYSLGCIELTIICSILVLIL